MTTHNEVETDHDYDGIQEHDNPLPRWWLWTFAGTVVYALIYWIVMQSVPNAKTSFDRYGIEKEDFDRVAYASAIDPAAILALSQDEAAVAEGRAVFQKRCVSCHADRAQGAVGPNLTDRYWLHGGDTKSIYATVASGYPKSGMPEWRTVLEDRDMQRVVAFLETVRNTNVEGRPPQGDEHTP